MYSPLPEQVEIRKSPIHGYGLFSKERIPKGTILGISHVAHDLFPDGWIRTPLGGMYNHSEIPNCKIVDETLDGGFLTSIKVLHTILDVEIGDELTCIYTIWKATEEMKKSSAEDDKDKEDVKKTADMLAKASKAHAAQSKDLKKQIKD